MSKLPWVRFFPSDWLTGTRGLSAAETGVYITLIMMMYDHGGPLAADDPTRLARLCGTGTTRFNAALTLLIKQGKIVRTADGELFNDRVRAEHEARIKFGNQQRSRIETGWEKKRNKINGSALPDGYRIDTENIPYHISHSDSEKKENKKEENKKEESVRATHTPRVRSGDDVSSAFDLWNETAGRLNLSTVRALSPARRSRLASRLKEHGLDGWRRGLEALASSPFCLGNGNGGWRANFDWITKPDKLSAVIEGNYRSTGPPRKNTIADILNVTHTYLKQR